MSFNLTQARLDSGHSVPTLAAAVGVPSQAIRRLEAGKAVQPATAKRVADFFDIKVTDLPVFAERAA